MKPGQINKIEGLFQAKHRQIVKGKKYLTGPYWHGWYYENYKPVQVYIGKELPKELQFLLDGRIKRPGRKLHIWPVRKPINEPETETHTP